MATWPFTLIQEPLGSNYEETYVESAFHYPMAIGRKNRLRDPSVVKTFNVRVPMDDTGKDTLAGFWAATLRNGTLPFDWIDFTDLLTVRSYLMLADPDISPTAPGVWTASMKLINAAPIRVIDTTVVPAPATWPASLPQGAAVSGWRETWNGYGLRSNLSAGQTMRQRGSFTEKRYSLSMMITASQKIAFETFYEDDLVLGTLPFSHTGWTTDGSSERYVCQTPPKFTGMGAGLLNLSIEVVTI